MKNNELGKNLWVKTSWGKNVLWGKLSVGKNVVGNIVSGKMSWGKLSFGEKCDFFAKTMIAKLASFPHCAKEEITKEI